MLQNFSSLQVFGYPVVFFFGLLGILAIVFTGTALFLIKRGKKIPVSYPHFFAGLAIIFFVAHSLVTLINYL